jgi:hypothetical protein
MDQYLVNYNFSNIPAGVYILELVAGDARAQLKIIIY